MRVTEEHFRERSPRGFLRYLLFCARCARSYEVHLVKQADLRRQMFGEGRARQTGSRMFGLALRRSARNFAVHKSRPRPRAPFQLRERSGRSSSETQERRWKVENQASQSLHLPLVARLTHLSFRKCVRRADRGGTGRSSGCQALLRRVRSQPAACVRVALDGC